MTEDAQKKEAQARAEAFQFGIYEFLKESGVKDPKEVDAFLKIAWELAAQAE